MEVHLTGSGADHILVTAPEFDAQFEVWGNCPVQAIGTVLGRDMYFRARHRSWTFDVADVHGNLLSDGQAGSDGFYREDEYTDAGWMTLTDAVKITTRCLEEYTGITALRGVGWPNPITRNLDG